MSEYVLRCQIDSRQADLLAAQCNINRITAFLLLARGIDTPAKVEKFFSCSLDDLTSPFLLSGIREAADKINAVLARKGRIMIYADYDADGIGAAAILFLTLKSMGTTAGCYIPNRKIEGYGLNISALEQIKKEYNPDLIITVDCGITSMEEVAFAKEKLGVDVIVTDHHEPQSILPNTICINPHLTKDYPPLCGAGVAFMLAWALYGKERAAEYLDICAVSTVADMVPLTGDNRIIASYGLKRFSEGRIRPGLKILADKIGLAKEISCYDIAFKIAPRLNAAGRIDSAYNAFVLLTGEDRTELALIAGELEASNAERQELCAKIFREAKEKLLDYDLFIGGAICLEDKRWDAGVAGIVAAKICEEFNRPAILFTHKDGVLKGSARSVNGANIYEALKSAKDILISFGGHSMAAGATLEAKNLPLLIKALNQYFKESGAEFYKADLTYDYFLDLKDIDFQLAKELEQMRPFGQGNPRPVFLSRYKDGTFGKMRRHNHITSRSSNINFIGFNMLDLKDGLNRGADLLYNIEMDYFKNKASVKGIIKNARPAFLPPDDLLTARYFDLYNAKGFTYRGGRKAPQARYGHLVIAYTKSAYISARDRYPDYEKEIYTLSTLNPVNAILLSPDRNCDFSYYGRITFADVLPENFAEAVLQSYGRPEYEPGAMLPVINTSLDVPKLREYYLLMKNALAGKEDNVIALYENSELKKQLTISDFSLIYNIFKELSLIYTDKNDIIYFSGQKVSLENSTLYLRAIKDKVDYAEAACAGKE
ncbi:MAG: single-stranded-DNA-specific exonuclease RecJ [Christensenellales bacterium]